jgi:hypothetical protein
LLFAHVILYSEKSQAQLPGITYIAENPGKFKFPLPNVKNVTITIPGTATNTSELAIGPKDLPASAYQLAKPAKLARRQQATTKTGLDGLLSDTTVPIGGLKLPALDFNQITTPKDLKDQLSKGLKSEPSNGDSSSYEEKLKSHFLNGQTGVDETTAFEANGDKKKPTILGVPLPSLQKTCRMTWDTLLQEMYAQPPGIDLDPKCTKNGANGWVLRNLGKLESKPGK